MLNIFTPIKRHPFSGRRELNTPAVRERNHWIETASHYCEGQNFWRERAEQRCDRDGHVFVPTDDGTGQYCTCCGAMTGGTQ